MSDGWTVAVVRNGRARERKITIGSGTLPIQAPRVNDKRVDDETGERQRFSSKILPAYARRSPKVNDVLPVLYLRGLSTGDFRPALEQLLGEDAAGLSPSTISRLCKDWEAEHERFRTRSLRFHQYAYWFVDGVHVQVRLGEDDRLCLLVVIGVREDGVKKLLAVEDGYRESTESWVTVMRDLKARGANEPKLVIGDGALGTWAALRDVFSGARRQACWVHAIANVLDALPKRLQPTAKKLLHEIMQAPSRADARLALERFREQFDAKYPKATAKLDRDWQHLPCAKPRSTTQRWLPSPEPCCVPRRAITGLMPADHAPTGRGAPRLREEERWRSWSADAQGPTRAAAP
jgi:putative transposase